MKDSRLRVLGPGAQGLRASGSGFRVPVQASGFRMFALRIWSFRVHRDAWLELVDCFRALVGCTKSQHSDQQVFPRMYISDTT